jgi:SacI homology domain
MDGKQDQQQVALFESWCCRIIQGSVQEYAGPFCNRSIIRYVLISRKSHKKAGTRFYARGIDDEGNVANFV